MVARQTTRRNADAERNEKYTRESKMNPSTSSFQIEARLALLPVPARPHRGYLHGYVTNLSWLVICTRPARTRVNWLLFPFHLVALLPCEFPPRHLRLAIAISSLPISLARARGAKQKREEKESLTSREREQGQGEISKTFRRCPDWRNISRGLR